MKRWAALAALVLVSCAAPKKPAPEDPPAEAVEAYNETSIRLVSDFLLDGQVVSRDGDGHPRHQGDSLLWTSLSIGALPCRLLQDVDRALQDNIKANAGHVVRFRPLPGEYAGGREASLDGALGLYWGLAHRVKRCGWTDEWREAFALHYRAVSESGWIYPGAARLTKGFDYVLDRLAHSAGVRGAPHADRLRFLEAEVGGWVGLIEVARQTWELFGRRKELEPPACFPANLSWLALSAVEAVGDEAQWDALCSASANLKVPHLDHECGRDGLAEFLGGFEFNRFEFALQRCPDWESADGSGLTTPGLDRLVGLTEYYDGLQ